MTKARWTGALAALLALNAGYLWTFAQPNLFYVGNVLAHVGLGAVLTVLVAFLAPILIPVVAAVVLYAVWRMVRGLKRRTANVNPATGLPR